MKFSVRFLSILAAATALIACRRPAPAVLHYQLLSTRPHDGDAYLQGLEFAANKLYESTGQYGQSTLREIDPSTGKILRKRPFAKQLFAEGLTIFNQQLFVLSWKENSVSVFEPDSFNLLRTHTYRGEGWGLTHNATQLIMSNGSSQLQFINPQDFSVSKILEVKDGETPLKNLNELEWIDGEIFANIYMTDKIARISPSDGQVTGWLDLSGLRNQLSQPNRAEVLNGIARDPASGHLFVTGKYWPQMFEIKILEKQP
jgi:glutaminyl-peptide cyclotransferase